MPQSARAAVASAAAATPPAAAASAASAPAARASKGAAASAVGTPLGGAGGKEVKAAAVGGKEAPKPDKEAPRADAKPVADAKDAGVGAAAGEVAAIGDGECEVDEVAPIVDPTSLKFAVPIKCLLSCYLLGPVALGDCRPERVCVPWLNVVLLLADIAMFVGHLLLSLKVRAYRDRVLVCNFYILLVSWSIWNVCSHPFCRQHAVDLFVAPPEIHVLINVAAIAACSSHIMAPPSVRHLIGLVTCEFLISLALSSIEVLSFHMDSGWLSAVRLDIVMFNVAIVLIGSTIIIGTMTVEEDIKSLAHEMDPGIGTPGSFEYDLERRKRAVLTALCDAVFTTNSKFQIVDSEDGADRVFRRAMLNENLTDYFRDQAEKDKFVTAVRKQFPDDGTPAESPKRMRVGLRDHHNGYFEADVVVSDASTDENGKVSRYMVGMHIRSEFRARTLQDPKKAAAKATAAVGDRDRRPGAEGDRDASKDRKDKGEVAGEDRKHRQMHDELSQELLAVFDGVLLPCGEPDGPQGGSCRADHEDCGATCPAISPPRFYLRRATCEVFRPRASLLGARAGERHGDLRRLSLPETTADALG